MLIVPVKACHSTKFYYNTFKASCKAKEKRKIASFSTPSGTAITRESPPLYEERPRLSVFFTCVPVRQRDNYAKRSAFQHVKVQAAASLKSNAPPSDSEFSKPTVRSISCVRV
jgi:hypothetical protein